MLFLKGQVSFPSNFVAIFNTIKHNPLYFFSSNIVYFGQRNQLKRNAVTFSSAWVKISQIPYVDFKTTSQFLFKFCIIVHCHGT